MSEHAHKWHQQHLKKKKEGNSGLGHAHKRHHRLEIKERCKICSKHVHYCKKKKKKIFFYFQLKNKQTIYA